MPADYKISSTTSGDGHFKLELETSHVAINL